MEIYNIISKRKYIFFLFIMIILQCGILAYNCYPDRTNDNKKENVKYVKEYSSEVEGIIHSADENDTVSIFSEESEFSKNNTSKTRQDFEKIADVKPKNIYTKSFDKFFGYNFFYYGTIVISFIVALIAVDDKNRGLECIIHSSKKGRQKHVIKKIGSILIMNFVLIFINMFCLALTSQLIYGDSWGKYLSYPIQSLSRFAQYTSPITIGKYLILFYLGRSCISFVISLIWWAILMMLSSVIIANGIVIFAGVIEVLLYKFIPVGSNFELLHYCNWVYILKDNRLLEKYVNLNILNQAINIRTIAFWVMAAMFVISMIVTFVYGSKKYPVSGKVSALDKYIKKAREKYCDIMGHIQEKLGVFAMEWYKLLVIQKGIIVLILIAVIWGRYFDCDKITLFQYQQQYHDFIDEYSGKITDESDKYISDVEKEVEDFYAEYEDISIKVSEGKLDNDELDRMDMLAPVYKAKETFTKIVNVQREYLVNLKEERGIEGGYLNQYSYVRFFDESETVPYFILGIAVAIICAGIFMIENTSKMNKLLNTCKKGRKSLYIKKMGFIMGFTTVLFLIEVFMHIFEVAYVDGLGQFGVLAQSFKSLKNLRFECSMLVYIIAFYVARWVMYMAIGIISANVAILTNAKVATISMTVFAVGVVTYFVNFWQLGTDALLVIASCAVAIICMVGSCIVGYNKWRRE